MVKAVPPPSRFRGPASIVLFVGALALGACQALPRVPVAVLFDPQLAPAEQTYFRQTFETRPGSVRLGPGWYAEEEDWGADHHGVCWAGKQARVYFGVPQARRAEVVALVTPLAYPGAPVQTVTPVLNGHPLPTVSLAAAWGEIRIPLPPEALTSPINALDLRFGHQSVPVKVGMGADTRPLAAAFNLLAVLPSGEPLEAQRSEVRGQGVERTLLLRQEPIAVPLPPATRYEILLGAVRGAGQRLALDFDDASGAPRRLWEGRPRKPPGAASRLPPATRGRRGSSSTGGSPPIPPIPIPPTRAPWLSCRPPRSTPGRIAGAPEAPPMSSST